MLTIVAYHYVRNIKNSKHYRIKGLEINEFNAQLNYIKKNYKVISADDIFDFYFLYILLMDQILKKLIQIFRTYLIEII